VIAAGPGAAALSHTELTATVADAFAAVPEARS
jgi:hypothetical protein